MGPFLDVVHVRGLKRGILAVVTEHNDFLFVFWQNVERLRNDDISCRRSTYSSKRKELAKLFVSQVIKNATPLRYAKMKTIWHNPNVYNTGTNTSLSRISVIKLIAVRTVLSSL